MSGHTGPQMVAKQPATRSGRGRRAWADGLTWAAALALSLLVVVAVIVPYLPLPAPTSQVVADRLLPPSPTHLLGTDDLGRDVLSRVCWGARYSLLIGLVAVALAAILGVPLGLLAGYRGGWLDHLLCAAAEIMLAFPTILLALVLVMILGPSLFGATLAVGLAQVPHYFRQTRGGVLAIRNQDYVLAAVAAGANTLRILRREILPNVLGPVLVLATMGLGGAILDAAGLSFLGLTGDPSRPEWGLMLAAARDRFLQQPWLAVAPGLTLTVAVLALNLVGDALRDRLDPRLSRRR